MSPGFCCPLYSNQFDGSSKREHFEITKCDSLEATESSRQQREVMETTFAWYFLRKYLGTFHWKTVGQKIFFRIGPQKAYVPLLQADGLRIFFDLTFECLIRTRVGWKRSPWVNKYPKFEEPLNCSPREKSHRHGHLTIIRVFLSNIFKLIIYNL